MQTVAAPASVRDQAFGICRAHGFGLLGLVRTPDGAGAAGYCGLLIALETVFRIDLDVDEMWPGARVTDLVALVERKVGDKARIALLPANDDCAGVPAPFIRRAPMFPGPNIRQVRERARRARRDRTRRTILTLVALAAYLGGAAGLVIGLAEIAPQWIAPLLRAAAL